MGREGGSFLWCDIVLFGLVVGGGGGIMVGHEYAFIHSVLPAI